MRPFKCSAEKAGVPATPDDLALDHTIISAEAGHLPPLWRFTTATPTLKPRLRVSTNDGAITAALAGFGLTRLLSYQVADLLRTGELTEVLADFALPARPVHIVHREGRHSSASVRTFVDLMNEHLTQTLH